MMLPRNPPGWDDPPDEVEEASEDDREPEDLEIDDTPTHNYHNFDPRRGW